MKMKSKSILILIPLLIVLVTVFTLIMPQFRVYATTGSTTTEEEPEDPEETEPEDTTVTEPAGTPVFAILKGQTFVIKAGQTTQVNIAVLNDSEDMAVNLNGTLEDEDDVITVSNVMPRASLVRTGCSETLTYNITVPGYVEAGKDKLTLNLVFKNKNGEAAEQSLTVEFDINSDLNPEALDIIEYSVDKTPVKSGDTFLLTMKLQNNSGVDLTNAQITLDGLDGTKFGMNGGMTSTSINIKKDAQTTLQFSLVACKGIASIREVIPVKMKYQLNALDKNTAQETTTNVTIACIATATKEDEDVFAPNIIISNYSFGGDYVLGGKEFPLSLTIKNTSSTATIQNLKVTIQGVAGTGTDTSIAFSPSSSSNSFFFENLGVNASQNISINLLPKVDATPNSYPLQVIFDYEYTVNDIKDKAETVTETITIPLQQDDRFIANSPEIETQAYLGQECPISVTLVNKGKSSVYNVSVDVEGEGFDKTSSAYYIGNVESGKEEYYDTSIIPNTEGEITGTIVVTYEDANGDEKEIREDFMTNSMQMMVDDGNIKDIPVDGEIKPEKKFPVALVAGIGGAVVVAAGAIVTFKIIKKKKLRAAEIEDDDETI